ncbi:MAG TPA: flagellar assembly protein A [Clostridium sp.]|uniref:flagellar assembly protein A n=1 Tax=Clostridium sp. TaxID=1506 RepID=UPI002F925B90
MVAKVGFQKFEGSNVNECLQSASTSLGVPIDSIKYSILEEKRGLFKKHAIISIEVIEDSDDEDVPKENTIEKNIIKAINGTIEIQQGRIIIKNPKEGGKPAVISAVRNIELTVDGEKINMRSPVYEGSNVEVFFKEEVSVRELNIRTSLDNMEAFISIIYKPTITYKLKDFKPTSLATLEINVKSEIMPPKFTEREIKNELQNYNIKYGIIEMNIVKATQDNEIVELLIANGKKIIEAVDDRLEIKYKKASNENSKIYDNEESIDYKAIGSVLGVEEGQVLAILYPGKNGQDGLDISGKLIKAKIVKKITLGVGEGCKMIDEYTVVATSQGRPSTRGNTFFVYKTHKIDGDVEIKTGNIQFVGDIVISGSVREGMKVEAGNSILVKNNVAQSVITASGDVVVRGNVISSTIAAGKEDVLTLEYLSDLKSMKNDITKLIEVVCQVKKIKLIQKNNSDGELIKVLLETKFKNLPKTSIRVAKRILGQHNTEDELIFIIKNKILDFGPLNIKSYEELNAIITIIDDKISTLEMNLTLPVDVLIDYAQDSIIKSSGNIIISGKGEYISQIVASDSIVFKTDNSLARGGVMEAGKEIKCKIVGGNAGVSTKLIVENHGQIWAEIAYPNTRFIIGDKEYVLDVASKNVHAFINDARELVVDKLLL